MTVLHAYEPAADPAGTPLLSDVGKVLHEAYDVVDHLPDGWETIVEEGDWEVDSEYQSARSLPETTRQLIAVVEQLAAALRARPAANASRP